jgi:hypothetical protein
MIPSIRVKSESGKRHSNWEQAERRQRVMIASLIIAVLSLLVGCMGAETTPDLESVIYPEQIIERGYWLGGDLHLVPLGAPYGELPDSVSYEESATFEWDRGFANIYQFPSDGEAEAAFTSLRNDCCEQSDDVTFVALPNLTGPNDFIMEGHWEFETELPVNLIVETTPMVAPLYVTSFTAVGHQCQIVYSLFAIGTNADVQDFLDFLDETRERVSTGLCRNRSVSLGQ